jgi:hypothetical protein
VDVVCRCVSKGAPFFDRLNIAEPLAYEVLARGRADLGIRNRRGCADAGNPESGAGEIIDTALGR